MAENEWSELLRDLTIENERLYQKLYNESSWTYTFLVAAILGWGSVVVMCFR